MSTGYTWAGCSSVRHVPPVPARQTSITNHVDSPLWWQNKFKLWPCEIGFPRSIKGLRIVERFSRFCSGPPLLFFFFSCPPPPPAVKTTACLSRETCSLLPLSSETGSADSLMKSIGHFGQMWVFWVFFWFPRNSSHGINSSDCGWGRSPSPGTTTELFVIVWRQFRHRRLWSIHCKASSQIWRRLIKAWPC